MTKRSGHSNCASTILYIQWLQRQENPKKCGYNNYIRTHNGCRCGKTYIRPGYRRKSHPCGTSLYMIECRLMSACTSSGSWFRIAADIVEGEHPRTPADGMQRRNGQLVEGKGKKLNRCFERTRAAFPPTGLISNSGHHSDIKRYCGY